MDEHGDETFLLVAMPDELIVEIDRLRDAIVSYMPGYDRKDFEILKKYLDWVENIGELLCVRDGK
tara:strand:+ start:326 stop:520 length:195 start_codon:yes stop_codon:yes gene_type:complete